LALPTCKYETKDPRSTNILCPAPQSIHSKKENQIRTLPTLASLSILFSFLGCGGGENEETTTIPNTDGPTVEAPAAATEKAPATALAALDLSEAGIKASIHAPEGATAADSWNSRSQSRRRLQLLPGDQIRGPRYGRIDSRVERQHHAEAQNHPRRDRRLPDRVAILERTLGINTTPNRVQGASAS
jgi:hypothetical protein